MRGRASFALTAFILLFLLQSLSALVATLFATLHDALYPALRPAALLPALLPLLALAAPVLKPRRSSEPGPSALSRLREKFTDRHGALMLSAVVVASARIFVSMPWHWVRFVAACVVLGAGAVFVLNAAGYIERRRVAGGLAAAITVDQMLRLAGWSWDLSMRSWWVLPQAALSGIVILLALAWRGMPGSEPDDRRGILERRAGGMRLRGATALGLLLFLDLHFLARAEIVAQWTGIRYEVAAVVLIAAGAVATLLLLAGHAPIGARRRTAAVLALVCGAAVLATPALPRHAGLLMAAAGHIAALLLAGRVLVPASGRRPGRNVAVLFGVWLLATALYTFTFFPSFTWPPMRDALPWLLTASAILLVPLLMLLPRPMETPPPLRGRVVVAGTLLLALAVALSLGLRQRTLPLVSDAGDTLRVATWNVHHGFGEDRQFDPARIADAIGAADADVVALQEVGAGFPAAYGTDLVLYLSRRLRLPAQFAATHNRVLGDALLYRVAVRDAQSIPLPDMGVDSRQASRFAVRFGERTAHVIATRLGLSAAERQAQAETLARLAEGSAPALILLGDLNSEPGDPVLEVLAARGLQDAFALAGVRPQPTAPAATPERRIDWILVRGLSVEAAAVRADGGSDHRMVTAELRIR